RWHQLPVFVWTSLQLSDDEQAQLQRSAHALVQQGGGAVGQMLERLRQWRPSGPLEAPGVWRPLS
ncbi:MAG: hypothetical protein CFE45_11165, partial [Burkholderiales bacterium PBB5]